MRVLEPFATQQEKLGLCECGIDVRERDGVEGEVPGGEPRVLPGVRHGDDVGRVEVPPAGVPTALPLWRRRWQAWIPIKPAGDVVPVVLLAPEHPRERLAHD